MKYCATKFICVYFSQESSKVVIDLWPSYLVHIIHWRLAGYYLDNINNRMACKLKLGSSLIQDAAYTLAHYRWLRAELCLMGI